jgi:alanyl-tRNA synthetase
MNTNSQSVRQAFLDFFAARGHQVVKSGPLVPTNDPSLMFTNAGMVQFKDTFTGREKRPYTRATSSQKCLRISGKHNDLEAVGPSLRHQTFFEMLGNFSFGDYFKEEAIVFAWEFLTKDLGLDPKRMTVTYFKGEGDLVADDTARGLWQKVSSLSDNRIIGLGAEDNFWQMGDTGPCGPCSEIHYYFGAEPDVSTFGAEQGPDGTGWLEFWNLVFMQFERRVAGDGVELAALPAPSIDTGCGLERLACILQGKQSNYDTDLLRAVADLAAERARKPYGGGVDPDDVSMRVIADHARTAAFLIAEGVLPDRSGRPYVLRRIMRRAVRHGHRLGIERPFLHEATLRVVEVMGDQYPELRERRDLICSICEQEEVRFRQTIERGLGMLEERFVDLGREGGRVLDGADAFKLYDTYGFPLDLTEVICSECGFQVDVEGYEQALEEARERSEFKPMDQAVENVYREALDRVPDSLVRFTGYERNEEQSGVVALVREGELSDAVEQGTAVEVITSSTPFYGESGGQVGDTGVIVTPVGTVRVEDTQRPVAGLIVHRGRVERGRIAVGDTVNLRIDRARRDAIRRNHSATHLLHLALRTLVGERAQQKGSVVGPDRLRFDFTHDRPLDEEQIAGLEDFVNERVLQNLPIRTEVLNLNEARKRGAMMIFEEKYGDVVRLLEMGESRELCGGTHARATGDIGLFKIVGEQGIAAGVRRLIAITGAGVVAHIRELEETVSRAARLTKTTPGQLVERVEKLIAREKRLEKQIDELERRLMTGGEGGGIETLLVGAREVGGVRVLGLKTEVQDRAALRELAEQLRDRLGQSVVLVGSERAGKAQLVLTVSKALTERFPANRLIVDIASLVQGSGGGRPDLAQAGGTEVARLGEAIERVHELVASGSVQ